MAVRQALLSAKSYTASIPAYDFLVSTCIYAVEFLVVHGHSTDLQFKRLRSWEAGSFKNYHHEIVKKPQSKVYRYVFVYNIYIYIHKIIYINIYIIHGE